MKDDERPIDPEPRAKRNQNWRDRLARYFGIMTKEEADLVFGSIMKDREQSKEGFDDPIA